MRKEDLDVKVLDDCKSLLKETLKGKNKYVAIADAYVEYFATKKAKSMEEVVTECRRSADELVKTLDYWKHRHIFTRDQFIENFSYSSLDSEDLYQIAMAAKNMAQSKEDADIEALEKMLEMAKERKARNTPAKIAV